MLVALALVLAPDLPVPHLTVGSKWREQIKMQWVPAEGWMGEEIYVFRDELEALKPQQVKRTRKLVENLLAGEKLPLPQSDGAWSWIETWDPKALSRTEWSDTAEERLLQRATLPRWPQPGWAKEGKTWVDSGWRIDYEPKTGRILKALAELKGVPKPGADQQWTLKIEVKKLPDQL